MSPDYTYRGSGRSLKPHEVAAKLTSVNPALATSRQARAATPAPTLIQGTVIKDAPAIEPPQAEVAATVTLPPLAENRLPAPELAPEWRERMASVLEPARCDRCGYRLAKCDCEARFGRRSR